MTDDERSLSRRDFARLGAVAAIGVGSAAPALASAQSQEVAPLESEFLMEILLDTDPGIDTGAIRIVNVTGGTFSGPRLRGTVLPGGAGDWITSAAGDSHLNVRLVLHTEDDAHISMTYRGIVSRQGGGQYWRVTPTFTTSSDTYDWINHLVAVGRSKQVPGKVAYDVFRIL